MPIVIQINILILRLIVIYGIMTITYEGKGYLKWDRVVKRDTLIVV